MPAAERRAVLYAIEMAGLALFLIAAAACTIVRALGRALRHAASSRGSPLPLRLRAGAGGVSRRSRFKLAAARARAFTRTLP